MNNKADFYPQPRPESEMESDVSYGICLCILCGVGAIINSIMIIAFMKEKKRKHYFNITYLNLSLSDLFWALYGLCVEGPSK